MRRARWASTVVLAAALVKHLPLDNVRPSVMAVRATQANKHFIKLHVALNTGGNKIDSFMNEELMELK